MFKNSDHFDIYLGILENLKMIHIDATSLVVSVVIFLLPTVDFQDWCSAGLVAALMSPISHVWWVALVTVKL